MSLAGRWNDNDDDDDVDDDDGHLGCVTRLALSDYTFS